MTVAITAKHDVSKNDNDNGTCCMDKKCDHTESLLNDFASERRNKNLEGEDMETISYYEKVNRLLFYEEAPEYMKHNPYILTGYRGILNTKLCMESVFWWTNETINIWSHIFGFVLFIAVTVRDLIVLDVHSHSGDKLILAVVLVCFQTCMVLSSLYHTFSCRSEKDCDVFLCYDLFGIALSLLAIYVSGIYYAFWCHIGLQNFYLFTIVLIFVIAMVLQIPQLNVDGNVKMLVFVGWALYGVLPTLHWVFQMGGFGHPLVQLLFPRVIGMYAISGTAFLIYLTKTPERFCAGKFDYLGHSHQWWHFLVVFALYFWHDSGMVYLEYRLNHSCADHMTII